MASKLKRNTVKRNIMEILDDHDAHNQKFALRHSQILDQYIRDGYVKGFDRLQDYLKLLRKDGHIKACNNHLDDGDASRYFKYYMTDQGVCALYDARENGI